MSSEESKGEAEIHFFLKFIDASKLDINKASIEKRNPPEPDIRCLFLNGETIAFELVEICALEMAKNREDLPYIRPSDPSFDIVRKKLAKNYKTNHPVELICYKNARTASPDNYIAERLSPLIANSSFQYRKIWLLGDRGVQLLWPKPFESQSH
jgi:hypothetical protein